MGRTREYSCRRARRARGSQSVFYLAEIIGDAGGYTSRRWNGHRRERPGENLHIKDFSAAAGRRRRSRQSLQIFSALSPTGISSGCLRRIADVFDLQAQLLILDCRPLHAAQRDPCRRRGGFGRGHGDADERTFWPCGDSVTPGVVTGDSSKKPSRVRRRQLLPQKFGPVFI